MHKLLSLIKGTFNQSVATVASDLSSEPKTQHETVAGVATVAGGSAENVQIELEFPHAQSSLIRQWLVHVGEEDPEVVAHIMTCCRFNQLDRDYFLRRAYAELPEPGMHPCKECRHLKQGSCDEVPLYEMPRAHEHWRPDPSILRRCHYFTPKANLKEDT